MVFDNNSENLFTISCLLNSYFLLKKLVYVYFLRMFDMSF
jgi:hypothetical protein